MARAHSHQAAGQGSPAPCKSGRLYVRGHSAPGSLRGAATGKISARCGPNPAPASPPRIPASAWRAPGSPPRVYPPVIAGHPSAVAGHPPAPAPHPPVVAGHPPAIHGCPRALHGHPLAVTGCAKILTVHPADAPVRPSAAAGCHFGPFSRENARFSRPAPGIFHHCLNPTSTIQTNGQTRLHAR